MLNLVLLKSINIMKNISILLFAVLLFVACKEGEEEKIEQENSVDKKEVEESNKRPLANMYGSDSIDASGNLVYGEEIESEEVTDGIQYPEEDLGYKLGTRPDKAYANQYGDDSIDAQGNVVYPPRDTIWDEE
jgi:hypothetical protein